MVCGDAMFKREGKRILCTILAVCIGLLLISCQQISGAAPHSYFSQGEQEALLLFKKISLGSTHTEVLRFYPHLSELSPEGRSDALAGAGLFEAQASAKLFERHAKVEFNFENGKLYSSYFFMPKLEQNTVIDLYQQIQEFYSSRLDPLIEEEERNGNRVSRSSVWLTDNLEVNAHINIENDFGFLSWGFNRPGPDSMGLGKTVPPGK